MTKIFFKLHGSVYRNSMLIKIQTDATVCRYLFTAKSLYMFRVSQHPSPGILKTVIATSGTGHNTGTATSLQRGLNRNCSPDQATLGSQCVYISEILKPDNLPSKIKRAKCN